MNLTSVIKSTSVRLISLRHCDAEEGLRRYIILIIICYA